MEKLAELVKTRKPMPFRASQMLYGVSVVLTFLLAGRAGLVA